MTILTSVDGECWWKREGAFRNCPLETLIPWFFLLKYYKIPHNVYFIRKSFYQPFSFTLSRLFMLLVHTHTMSWVIKYYGFCNINYEFLHPYLYSFQYSLFFCSDFNSHNASYRVLLPWLVRKFSLFINNIVLIHNT